MNGGVVGKWLVVIGLVVIALGIFLWLGNKIGIPFGKLPGDLSIKKERISIYFPVATSIILSVILTIIINLIIYFKK